MRRTSSFVSKYFLFYGFLFDKNKTTVGPYDFGGTTFVFVENFIFMRNIIKAKFM